MTTTMEKTTPAVNPAFTLDASWLAWITENSRLGVAEKEMITAMMARGCPEGEASVLVRAFSIHAGVSKIGSTRLEKTKWLLESLRNLQGSGGFDPCSERGSINASEFIDSVYSRNFPVVYRAGLSPANLSNHLSWSRLGSDFGDLEVEVQEGRSSRADYERSSNELKSRARLADFLQRAQSAGESNDFYMTANNSSANAALIEAAIKPESVCPELLDGNKAHGHVFLWIGPCGTFTPAHHDLTNNLFLQAHGSKEFRLASSLALLDLDNDRHCYLKSSLSDNDESRKLARLEPLSFTVTLEACDVLFIPLGWWHEVRGLSPSISLSATTFRARNDFYQTYEFFGGLK